MYTLSQALLRRRGLGSLIEAILEGNPIAIALVLASVGGAVIMFALLVQQKRADERRFEADVLTYGRDLALVRRAARAHRLGYSHLAMAVALMGLICGIAFLGISPWASFWAVIACGVAIAGILLWSRRVPAVDEHPLFLMSRDTPARIVSATWAPQKHLVYLTIKTREPEEKTTYKLDRSWGVELIGRLPTLFPNAALHVIAPNGQVTTIKT